MMNKQRKNTPAHNSGLSDDLFSTIFMRNTAIMSLVRLSDGKILAVNEAWIRAFGYSSEEVCGKSSLDFDLWPAHEIPKRNALYRDLRDRGRIKDLEFRLRRRTGEPFVLLLSSDVVSIAGEQIIVSSGMDITERNQSEQAIRKNEEMLRKAMEAAQAGTWQVEPATGEFTASPNAMHIHGLEPDKHMTHERALASVFPDDSNRVEASLQHTLETGEPLRLEHRIRRSDGTLRWVESYAERMDEEGRTMLVGFVRDITDRKKIEEQLAEKNHVLESALAGAHLGTWDTDLESRRSIFDERYCAMLGYRIDEFEPSMDAWLRLVHPEDLALVNAAFEEHRAGDSSLFEVEHRLRHKDGHWVWVLARGKITRDENNNAVRASGVHQDISDRKRASKDGIELLEQLRALLANLDERPQRQAGKTTASAAPRLSGRNREVIQLIAEGRTSAEIAAALGVTAATAKTHRRDLMRKLNLKNTAEIIRYAIRQGIVNP